MIESVSHNVSQPMGNNIVDGLGWINPAYALAEQPLAVLITFTKYIPGNEAPITGPVAPLVHWQVIIWISGVVDVVQCIRSSLRTRARATGNGYSYD